MPVTIRTRSNYSLYPEYPYYRVIVEDTTDLRGVDLSDALLANVDLTGCQRLTTDPPIPDWYLTEDGTLAWVCPACEGSSELGFEDRAPCGDCAECCEHPCCSRCGDHCGDDNTRHCGDCDRCGDCCECIHCERCGDSCNDDYCPDCSENGVAYCESCCRGHASEDDAPTTFDPGPPRRSSPKDRLAGVEWEHNDSFDCSDLKRKYGVGYHSDGSCGWEAVTPPMGGAMIDTILNALQPYIKEAGANEDCSAHVHVDASDLSWADMYRLAWVYSRIEPILYVLGGQQRVNNTYCKPCGPAFRAALADIDRKGALLSAVFYGDHSSPCAAKENQRFAPGKKIGGRYKGLNLAPWLHSRRLRNKDGSPKRKDCTVEFRIHRNTTDATRLINWTRLLIRIVDWVATHTDAEAQALPRSALRALCTIAPESRPWIMSRVRQWRQVTTTSTKESSRPAPRRVRLKNGEYTCAA